MHAKRRRSKRAGIVERKSASGAQGADYCLTPAGFALKPVVSSIGEWGQRWARDIRPEDLDPGWLVWAMHRRLNTSVMPAGRTVIEIEFIGEPASQRRFWLVHCDGKVDVCLKDPGYETSVRVSARTRALAEVWRGLRPLEDALREGVVVVEGTVALRRAFPQWLLFSVFAGIPRERGGHLLRHKNGRNAR